MRIKIIKWLLKPIIKDLRMKGNAGKYKNSSDKLYKFSKGLAYRIINENSIEAFTIDLDLNCTVDTIYFFLLRNLDDLI